MRRGRRRRRSGDSSAVPMDVGLTISGHERNRVVVGRSQQFKGAADFVPTTDREKATDVGGHESVQEAGGSAAAATGAPCCCYCCCCCWNVPCLFPSWFGGGAHPSPSVRPSVRLVSSSIYLKYEESMRPTLSACLPAWDDRLLVGQSVLVDTCNASARHKEVSMGGGQRRRKRAVR